MNKAIIGLGFGDEGKGITTDYLCSQSDIPLVVRFSGGHQAGHTVYYNGKSHIFSNFGSGTLRGIPTYWSKFCTIDPVGIMNEFEVLLNINIQPKLYIDKDSPITTIYDKLYNQETERKNQHGSCGVGYSATIEREKNHYHLTFGDLKYPSVFLKKLDLIKEYYEKRLSTHLGKLFVFEPNVEDPFLVACRDVIDSKYIIEGVSIYSMYHTDVIYEGSQGLMLDQNYGYFPHVTRANTGTKNLLKLLPKHHDIEYYLVTRAYQTRHGNGPIINEECSHNIKENPEETNVTKEWQGNFRKTILDVDQIRYAISKDFQLSNSLSKKVLVVTCLDHIEDYKFTYNGKLENSVNEKEFLRKLSIYLQIRTVLASHSNDSKNFKKYSF